MTSSKLVLRRVAKLQQVQLVALVLAFTCVAVMAATSGSVELGFTIACGVLVLIVGVLGTEVEILLYRLRQSWTRRPR